MNNQSKDKEEYKYPSRFGSHVSMIEKAETDKLHDPDLVVCKDENGLYVTQLNRLDNGMADANRFSDTEWRQEHLRKVAGEVIEIIS